jgi:hypothetical protein
VLEEEVGEGDDPVEGPPARGREQNKQLGLFTSHRHHTSGAAWRLASRGRGARASTSLSGGWATKAKETLTLQDTMGSPTIVESHDAARTSTCRECF